MNHENEICHIEHQNIDSDCPIIDLDYNKDQDYTDSSIFTQNIFHATSETDNMSQAELCGIHRQSIRDAFPLLMDNESMEFNVNYEFQDCQSVFTNF